MPPSSGAGARPRSEALAAYLRYLVEDSGLTLRDPHDGARRKARYGDIAVMMVTTQTVHHLTAELDVVGVPHVVRGGTLFMNDPLHRQFVLGLRALSDRDDGAARAALLRPPFFAVSLATWCARVGEAAPALVCGRRARARARSIRHETTHGETAGVLEQTGSGLRREWRHGARASAAGRAVLRATRAERSGLDYDGVTAIARGWIDAPARIEAPLPIDADAVQVITAHQAKGLEWPIVALWDGRAVLRGYLPRVALRIDPLSGRWAVRLDGLAPIRAIETCSIRAGAPTEERKRIAYGHIRRATSDVPSPASLRRRKSRGAGSSERDSRTRGVKLPAWPPGGAGAGVSKCARRAALAQLARDFGRSAACARAALAPRG